MAGNITDFMDSPATVEKGGKMHDQLVEMEALLSETAHQEDTILSEVFPAKTGISTGLGYEGEPACEESAQASGSRVNGHSSFFNERTFANLGNKSPISPLIPLILKAFLGWKIYESV